MFDIIVLGAGASGLAAAIGAKRKNKSLSVALVEALPRVGKKILATGNGRCNLSNINASEKDYSSTFVKCAMDKFPPERIKEFFGSMGLACRQDDAGRVYPLSGTAASVLDALRFEARLLEVHIICNTHIDSVRKQGETFILNDSIKTKILIISTGGKASPSQGSDGSGYKLLKSLGHGITELNPGLVQLTVSEDVRSLKGIRVKAQAAISDAKIIISGAEGEVLFTDYGLSGIAIMDISRFYRKNDGNKYICSLDMMPEYTCSRAEAFIKNTKYHNPNLTAEDILNGFMPRKAGAYIIKKSGLNVNSKGESITEENIKKIVKTAKDCRFLISGTKGYSNAQITVGGACTKDFCSETLESCKVKGLYCTGELLNVDAPCGGYNLQWAWASGLLAGESAAEAFEKY